MIYLISQKYKIIGKTTSFESQLKYKKILCALLTAILELISIKAPKSVQYSYKISLTRLHPYGFYLSRCSVCAVSQVYIIVVEIFSFVVIQSNL